MKVTAPPLLLQSEGSLLGSLATSLKVKKLDDWFKISKQDVLKLGGQEILSQHSNNLSLLLQNVFPEHRWPAYRFIDRVPHGYWNDPKNQREFMDDLKNTLQLKEMDDWYGIKHTWIVENGGGGLLDRYEGSPSKLLQNVYPDHPFSLALFETKPLHYKEHHKRYLDDLGKKLGYLKMEDWYSITKKDFDNNILSKYSNSPSQLLREVYSDHIWNLMDFKKVSKGYWNDIERQRDKLNRIGKELGITLKEKWYEIGKKELIEKGGGSLLIKYANSPFKMLNAIYPDHIWNPMDFKTVYKGYWDDIEHQGEKLDQIGKELGLTSKEDWYKIGVKELIRKCGSTLVTKYGDSPFKMLSTIYPDHIWNPMDFQRYWDDTKYQREKLDRIGKELGITSKEDWYEIRVKELIEKGGWTLVNKYRGSPFKMLTAIYPNHVWEKHRYELINRRLTVEQKMKIVKTISERLRIRDLEDWYRISGHLLQTVFRRSLFTKITLFDLLSEVYPNHVWEKDKLAQKTNIKRSSQGMAFRIIRDLFPNCSVKENYRIPNLRWESTGRPIELDIFVEEKNLAFEYQGIGHYREVPTLNSNYPKQNERDRNKKEICKTLGIKLITIPYWQKLNEESLEETIRKQT